MCRVDLVFPGNLYVDPAGRHGLNSVAEVRTPEFRCPDGSLRNRVSDPRSSCVGGQSAKQSGSSGTAVPTGYALPA
jgi:hypothetical protein